MHLSDKPLVIICLLFSLEYQRASCSASGLQRWWALFTLIRWNPAAACPDMESLQNLTTGHEPIKAEMGDNCPRAVSGEI